MASFLYCFPYSYRSFTLLKALAKSNVNIFAIACKSEKERQLREREPSKKKQWTNTKKDAKRIKSDNFTRSNKEKSNIAIAISENEWLDGTIIISYFGSSNNILAKVCFLN